MNESKKKALDMAISQIEKDFGKGSVMTLGENETMNIDHISTGSFSLDIALGIGGVPKGRIVEIYGPESSGTGASGEFWNAFSPRGANPPHACIGSVHSTHATPAVRSPHGVLPSASPHHW